MLNLELGRLRESAGMSLELQGVASARDRPHEIT
jgi:hypothetical protein